jgi:mRNA-degrading endonuclease YafQ of YafQ-DinJ toxin-antitoxin module
MYTLSWSTGFRKGFKKVTRKNPEMQEKIFSTLEKLSMQPFDPEIKTHKSLIIYNVYHQLTCYMEGDEEC